MVQQIADLWTYQLLSEACVRYSINSDSQRCLEADADHDKVGMLASLTGVLPYSQFNPALAGTIQALVAKRPDLFPGGWLGSAAGKLGYAYFLQP